MPARFTTPEVRSNGSASPRYSATPGACSPPIASSPCDDTFGASAKRPFQSKVSPASLLAESWNPPPSGVVRKSLQRKRNGRELALEGPRAGKVGERPPGRPSRRPTAARRPAGQSPRCPRAASAFFGARSARFIAPSRRMTARTSGTSTITSLKISVRCQSEASSKSTNRRRNPSIGEPSASGKRQVANLGLQLERVDRAPRRCEARARSSA